MRDPRSGLRGVYFLSTAITATAHALAGRWLAEGIPMHVLAGAELGVRAEVHHLRLDPGAGSAPDAEATLRPAPVPTDGPWRACFASWEELLAYVVPQDRVLAPQPERRRIRVLDIDLGIPLASCQPLQGEITSRAARAIAGDAAPFAFRVPAVPFLFRDERRR